MMYVIMKSRFNSQVVSYPTDEKKTKKKNKTRTRFIKNELKNEDTKRRRNKAGDPK